MLSKILDLILGLLTGRDAARETGRAETRDAVSSAALVKSEEDRKSKERTDAQVRATPDDDLISRL